MGRLGHLFALVAVLFVFAVGAALAPLLSPAEDTPVAEAPLTVEELGQVSVTEVMTATPSEVRGVIAARHKVKTTFENCDSEGAPGLKVRTACVSARSTNLTLGAGDISIFETKGRFEDLRFVEIRGGALANLSALTAYPALRGLVLIDVRIKDASALSELTGLTTLELSGSNIADIAPLAGMTKLNVLGLFDTQIADISPLANSVTLTRLHLDQSRILDIPALRARVGLTSLDIDRNPISDISALAGLTRLSSLDLHDKAITSIAPLAGLPELGKLDIRNTGIADLTPVEGRERLQIKQ